MSQSHDHEKRFNYFAYGSNMLHERILLNNPSAVFVSQGELKGYVFGYDNTKDAFSWLGAIATISPDPGNCVWGVIFAMALKDQGNLDRQELNYSPIDVEVTLGDGSTSMCRTYVMKPETLKQTLPSPYYKKVIVDGAKQHNLPEEYINFLDSFPDTGNSKVPEPYKKILALREKMGGEH